MKRLLLPIISLLLLGCSERSEKPLIVTSIYPLTWTVKELYPEYSVYQLVKSGDNPHLYDLSPKDALKIEEAKKVFLIGNLEPFAEKIPEKKKVEVIKVLKLSKSANPHLWLSPKRWLEFLKRLPQAVADLKINPRSYKKTLEIFRKLDREYEKLKGLKLSVVMIHPAFVWLCKDYNVNILGILETKVGLGISTKRYTQIVNLLKNYKGRLLILYVSINPKGRELARKLSKETGVRAVGLNPAIWEGEKTYPQILEENLKRILEALKS